MIVQMFVRITLSAIVLMSAVVGSGDSLADDDLTVPAFTVYVLPDANGVRVDEGRGVVGWNNPSLSVAWFGEFRHVGKLQAELRLKLSDGNPMELRLAIDDVSHVAKVAPGGDFAVVDFGEFPIAAAGYHKIALSMVADEQSKNAERQRIDIESLRLRGEAVQDAHFNLKPRRNAASVHLAYRTPKDAKVEAFYSEVTAVDDPVTTFYMACGFHRGYFGMQVNSETERRIIFSVWDAGSGASANDRSSVNKENHVSLIDKGEGVHTSVFGGEGTGGHSHLKYLWKTGETQRFVVTAKPVDEKDTIFSGYYFHPDQSKWMLISSMRAPRDGGYLRGLHSFSENFWGSTGHVRRKALFGNQWIRSADGEWSEITEASFSHDPTGKADRLDRFMGVEGNRFFLSHGGFVPGSTSFGERFTRPSGGTHPEITLP